MFNYSKITQIFNTFYLGAKQPLSLICVHVHKIRVLGRQPFFLLGKLVLAVEMLLLVYSENSPWPKGQFGLHISRSQSHGTNWSDGCWSFAENSLPWLDSVSWSRKNRQLTYLVDFGGCIVRQQYYFLRQYSVVFVYPSGHNPFISTGRVIRWLNSKKKFTST